MITSDQKTSILKLCHVDQGCHLGIKKTFYTRSERYYWKGMSNDAKDYIKRCIQCQQTNKKSKTTTAEMQPVECPKSTWRKIAIDLVGPIMMRKDNHYQQLDIDIDYFSNYLEAFALKRKLATEVAVKLFELFCRQGVTLELVSDNGGEFNSLLTSTIEKQYGYRHILITTYHPQSNGKCERVNQTVKSMLNKTIEEMSSQWELCLPRCVFSYNTSKQSSTRYSPFFLMY